MAIKYNTVTIPAESFDKAIRHSLLGLRQGVFAHDFDMDTFVFKPHVVRNHLGYSITEEMLEDEDALYNNPPEPKMNLYFYAIVQTKKNGEYKEVLESGVRTAYDAERARMEIFVDAVNVYQNDVTADKIEVVVRPF